MIKAVEHKAYIKEDAPEPNSFELKAHTVSFQNGTTTSSVSDQKPVECKYTV